MPQYPNRVTVAASALPTGAATAANQNAGFSFKNYAANNAGDATKASAGVLRTISVNKAGTTSTLAVYDGASTAGTLLGTFDTSALRTITLNATFATGLFVVLAGGSAADVTVIYS